MPPTQAYLVALALTALNPGDGCQRRTSSPAPCADAPRLASPPHSHIGVPAALSTSIRPFLPDVVIRAGRYPHLITGEFADESVLIGDAP
jgi:hypothetical protein